jgi:hypothetical protein
MAAHGSWGEVRCPERRGDDPAGGSTVQRVVLDFSVLSLTAFDGHAPAAVALSLLLVVEARFIHLRAQSRLLVPCMQHK